MIVVGGTMIARTTVGRQYYCTYFLIFCWWYTYINVICKYTVYIQYINHISIGLQIQLQKSFSSNWHVSLSRTPSTQMFYADCTIYVFSRGSLCWLWMLSFKTLLKLVRLKKCSHDDADEHDEAQIILIWPHNKKTEIMIWSGLRSTVVSQHVHLNIFFK